MVRNSLGLPLAALVAAALGLATVAWDLGWFALPSRSAGDAPVVDGTVAPGEYAHSYTAENIGLTLRWSVVGDELWFAVQAPAQGWVAVGFGGDGPLMMGADIVIGYADDAGARVRDNYAEGPASHSADETLGGRDDLLASAVAEHPGGTVLEARRKLDTGDAYDHAITVGSIKTMFGYADADDFMTYHLGSKALAEIDYLTPAVAGRQWVPEHLSEYQIGLLAWVLVLAVFGIVGVASVWLEGRELSEAHPAPAGGNVAAAAVTLFAVAALGGSALFMRQVAGGDASVAALGVTATFWMWSLAAALAAYRRYFMAGEVIQQDRHDEVPW